MSEGRHKQVLQDIRRTTDEFTVKRKRREISDKQTGLEDYYG